MFANDREGLASLIVRNESSELARVSDWVHAWAERQKLPGRLAQQLDLCSTEVVTNIMTHAYADDALHQISLRLCRQGEQLALEIEDDGRAFDPMQADLPPPAETLDNARVGGWGIPIVRRFADDLQYRRSAGRNHLTLIFRPSAPVPP